MSIDLYSFLDDFKDSRLIGGAEKQQFLLINELLRRNHKVLICTNTKKLKTQPKYKYNLYHYPIEHKYLKYALIFLKLIQFNPDVVYLRSPSNIGIALSVYTKLFRKKMVYFSAHDTDFDLNINLQNYNERLFRIFVKLTDIFFIQNVTQLQLLKTNFQKTGHVFGNIIQVEKPAAFCSISKRKYFLWVARIEPFKKLELLFEIAKKLSKESFIVIAPCNVKNDYSKNILNQINQIDNITYIPFVKPEQISLYYHNAKGIICTSKYEGFPNTFLEAFNTGTPVYTFGVDPNNIIKKSNRKLGYVFSSIDDFIENINNIIKDHDPHTMFEYLKRSHSLKENVDRFLSYVS
jgi:glycosyltransferase involved in cell wall biosynthesis